jgi:hypothetical protein
MGTDNIDWKNAGIGAAKVVLGIGTVAAGVTGGPAGATGVQQLGSGLDQALGGLGVGNVGLSQTGTPAPQATPPLAQATPAAPTPPSAPAQPTITPIATAPIVAPLTPPLVPPQSEPSRLERFERDGRPLPSPPPPPGPSAEEIERENLLRSLELRGWTPSEARILVAGRSRDSLRLIGPIVPDTAVRASAVPMEMVRGGPVKQVSGTVRFTGSSPPWLLWFARYRLLGTAERSTIEGSLLQGIADNDPLLLTALGQLPLGEITLPQVGAVPMAELQRDMERLSAEQLWLLRAAVAGSLANRGK